jgi:type 1 fimbria pilin
MILIRKYALAISALALPLAAVAIGPATATAAVRPHSARPHSTVTFKGKITCTVSGYMHFTQVKHPTLGLEFTTKENVKLWLQIVLTHCKGATSQGGAKIESGSVSGAITGEYSCASLLNSVPSPNTKIKWTTKGNAATDSLVALSGGKLETSPRLGVDYTATAKDSFAGSGTVKTAIYQTEGDLINSCKKSPYLKKVTIDPKYSTLSI